MVTVQLPDDVFQKLTAAAAAQQMTFERFLEKMSGRYVPQMSKLSTGKNVVAAFQAVREKISYRATSEEIKADIEEGRQ